MSGYKYEDADKIAAEKLEKNGFIAFEPLSEIIASELNSNNINIILNIAEIERKMVALQIQTARDAIKSLKLHVGYHVSIMILFLILAFWR